MDKFAACSRCRQGLLVGGPCPCGTFTVWEEDSPDVVRHITAGSFNSAAEEYVDRYGDTPGEGDEVDVIVRDYQGLTKRVTVYAEVIVELCSTAQEYEPLDSTG